MQYIYVRAEAPRDDLTMVSFAHVPVTADDDEDAYTLGRNHFKVYPTAETARQNYRFLNDYVVNVEWENL